MLRVVSFFACLVACSAHAVLPLVHHVPVVHSHIVASPYLHGYAGHELLGHGYGSKPLVHHLLKRSPSPHLVGHVGAGHLVPVAPVAVSHQSRVDVHSSPAVVPVLPAVKPLGVPVLHAAPILHKSFVGPYAAGYYGGVGPYGALHPHLGHY